MTNNENSRILAERVDTLSSDAFDLVFELSSVAVENIFPTRQDVETIIVSRGLMGENDSILKILNDLGVILLEGEK